MDLQLGAPEYAVIVTLCTGAMVFVNWNWVRDSLPRNKLPAIVENCDEIHDALILRRLKIKEPEDLRQISRLTRLWPVLATKPEALKCFRGHEDETGAVFTSKNGSIEVDAAATKFTVSLTLNDDGECRYRIDDGPQEYLRWQVIRRALQPVFFPNA